MTEIGRSSTHCCYLSHHSLFPSLSPFSWHARELVDEIGSWVVCGVGCRQTRSSHTRSVPRPTGQLELDSPSYWRLGSSTDMAAAMQQPAAPGPSPINGNNQ